MLRAYRASTAASDALRESVRGRLDASTTRVSKRSHWVVPIAAATAIAAAALLWIAAPQRSMPTDPGARDHAAPFVHERDDPRAEARSSGGSPPSDATGQGVPQAEATASGSDPLPSLGSGSEEGLRPSRGSGEPETVAPRSRKPTRPEPLETETAGPDLAAEMEVLRRAGTLVRTGDGERAVTVLDEHARRFPGGQLVEDREALRVQALCAKGDAAAAREAARAFEAAHPKSPHLRRVRHSAADCRRVPQ
jgi:hypothetical protein